MIFFSISNLTLAFDVPTVTEIGENFSEFITSHTNADCEVFYKAFSKLPKLKGEILYSETSFDVLKLSDSTFVRRFHKHLQENQYYAYVFTDTENQESTVHYLADYPVYLRDMNQCFSLSNWEKLMIHRGRIILHSALIRSQYGGIAFLGPSGIGKSTQASLWEEYERAELINGDKPIFYRSESGWVGCGSPFAGSSRCYLNEQVSINAMVILGQGRVCTISRLSVSAAFRQVFSNCTAYKWDADFMSLAVSMITDLVSTIPVYQLICTPDYSAVNTLKTILSEGDCRERN